MSESPSISVRINPLQGAIDANASGELAIAALVLIVAMVMVAMTVWVLKRPTTPKIASKKSSIKSSGTGSTA